MAAQSAQNDPKLGPQNDPRSIQNRVQKMIKNLIASKGEFMRLGGWPGGVRGPLGGNKRGVINAQVMSNSSSISVLKLYANDVRQ